MSYPRAVLTSWLVACVLAVGSCSLANAADLYLNLAGGVSIGQHTAPDGIWYQKGLNYSTDMQSIAWKAGAGMQGQRWGIEANYVNLGTRRVHSTFVDDAIYSVKQHRCTGTAFQCSQTGNLTASDAMQGVELLIKYYFNEISSLRPYVTFGGAWMLNRFTVENYNLSFTQKLYGGMPMAVGGIGLAYKWAYLEADYYSLVGKQPDSTPISTQVVLTTFGFRIPLGG